MLIRDTCLPVYLLHLDARRLGRGFFFFFLVEFGDFRVKQRTPREQHLPVRGAAVRVKLFRQHTPTPLFGFFAEPFDGCREMIFQGHFFFFIGLGHFVHSLNYPECCLRHSKSAIASA